MKKRTVILVLAMVLSLSVVGCGNSNEEPKQEEQKQEEVQQQEEEQTVDTEVEPEKDYSDLIGKEFENDDIYIKIESTEQTVGFFEEKWEEAYGQLTADQDIPIYCDGGFQVGYIKTGAVIDITEHGIYQGNPSAYYRFENPISELPFDYLYVSYLDCNYELFKVETESSLKDSEEGEQETEETSPYDEILEKAGYDKDKTYTEEEYIEVLTKIFEEMGKEYNADVEKDFIDYTSNKTTFDGYHVMMSYYSFDFSDHEKTLQNTKTAMSYVEGGLDGSSNITEFAIGKGQKDGEETINIYIKVAH